VETTRSTGADGEDRRRRRRGSRLSTDGATAWRSGRRVRLVASSSKRRMGARLGAWKRKKGGLAAGKTRGRWCQAGAGGRSGRGKIGEEGKLLTGGAQLLCWWFKSNQTDPK
jgi:hypothetical protein